LAALGASLQHSVGNIGREVVRHHATQGEK
jgi:hypothetical protein